MLKLKDNVDLKELEKYGFKKMNNINFYCKEVEYSSFHAIDYYINNNTRTIEINTNNRDELLDNTLYDLIKNDLIEKVEDK